MQAGAGGGLARTCTMGQVRAPRTWYTARAMALVKSNVNIVTGRKLKKEVNTRARKWPVKAKYAAKKRTGEKEAKTSRRIFLVTLG